MSPEFPCPRNFPEFAASYPMDDAHLMAAIRYVENNPVAAAMVAQPQDWRWSSARSHATGTRHADDPLTDLTALTRHVRNWRAYWRHGAALADADVAAEALVEAIEQRLRTGRPLAAEQWIAGQEERSGRAIVKRRPGPKPNLES
jgi:putative transposase